MTTGIQSLLWALETNRVLHLGIIFYTVFATNLMGALIFLIDNIYLLDKILLSLENKKVKVQLLNGHINKKCVIINPSMLMQLIQQAEIIIKNMAFLYLTE